MACRRSSWRTFLTESPEQLAVIFKQLKLATSGLARAVRNEHAPTKLDLQHWAKAAARRSSAILLADMDESEQPLSRGDAEELIAAWYLENRLWDALAEHRRVTEKEDQRQRDQREDGGTDKHHEGQGGTGDERDQRRDDQRSDKLMCFWVTDFNALPGASNSVRRMYVCVDPETGAIISQRLEAAMVTGL